MDSGRSDLHRTGSYRSDGGATWTPSSRGIAGHPAFGDLILKTVDGGGSWTQTSRGLLEGAAAYSVAVDPHRRDTIYAGLTGRVYRSLDAGRSWQLLGNGLPTEAPVITLLPSASNPDRLYAVSAGHGLFWEELEGDTF
jgi:photosystem II stability/assembly factor-like uncharacterized protein